MAFRREGDPVEVSAEGINAARFQVDGQVDVTMKGLGQGLKVVLERFSTRDHNKSGSVVSSVQCKLHQRFQRNFGMLISRPGVFGVTPRTTHIAAGQTNEKGTASGMVPLSLQGMERFHHPESLGVSHQRRSWDRNVPLLTQGLGR